MSDAIALLWPSFVLAICLVGIHAYFGIHVLARKVIFVDLALAQIAALGTTVAFMLGHATQGVAAYWYSLLFTLAAALLLAFVRGWSGRIPQEALIGVIYVVAAAAAILLIDQAPQGAEHLKQILTGNILTSGIDDIVVVVPIYAAIGILHWLFRRRMQATNESWVWEFAFYASFGMVVTSSVSLAGVLLVFSFLIIPAAIGVLYADRFSHQLLIGWVVGVLASIAGLAASYLWNLPTGAAMVCVFGATLALATMLYPFLCGDARTASRQTLRITRWGVAALLAISGLSIMALPRADQPLLDMVESALPATRSLYFNGPEAATYRDAAEYAARYAREVERLNAMEADSRGQGQELDDTQVRQISSFLKSYGEMRKGEEFVMREVRVRARERSRFALGGGALLIAILIVPGVFSRLRNIRARNSGDRRSST